jgi:hypothetical protein
MTRNAQTKLSFFSDGKNPNVIAYIFPVEVKPTTSRSGIRYLFNLYVESMISMVGNVLKSFTESGWAHKISFSVSVPGRTL